MKNRTKKATKKVFKNVFSVHFSFIFLIVISALFSALKLVLEYFIMLIIHEMVHAFFAKKRGYKLGKIRLTAGGAILQAEQDEFTFKDEIAIAISAPIFNLCFALFLVALWWLFPVLYNYTQDLAVINFAIFMFNILPLFPLDGGRVLLGFLSLKLERKKATKICKTITIIVSLCLFGLFVVSLFILPVFAFAISAINLFISVCAEDKNAVYKRNFYLERKHAKAKKSGIEARQIYIDEQQSILSVFKLIDARHYTTFYVVKDNFKVLKVFDEAEVLYRIERGDFGRV